MLRQVGRSAGLAFATLAAVALGVAIALCSHLADAAAADAFVRGAADVAPGVALQIRGPADVDERFWRTAATLDGVREARPIVEDELFAGTHVLRAIGLDTLLPLPGDAEFRERLPGPFDAAGSDRATRVLLRDDGVVVGAELARRLRLHRGGTVAATAGTRRVAFRVAAILPPHVAALDTNDVLMDVSTAQRAFDRRGRLDRIDLVADADDVAAIRTELERALPASLRVSTPHERTNEVRRLSRNFGFDLGWLGFIAALVSVALAYGASATTVNRRRGDIAVLRTLGTSRATIARAFVFGAAAFGAVGALVGVALGLVATMLERGTADVPVPAADLVAFIAGGTIAAALSAAGPAHRASRAEPARQLSPLGAPASVAPPPATRSVLLTGTLAALALALATLAVRPGVDVAAAGYVAAACALGAFGAIVVPALTGLARVVRARAGTRAIGLALGAAHLAVSARRAGLALAALGLAVASLVASATVTSSFHGGVTRWAQHALAADLSIRRLDAGATAATLPAALTATIRALPGVAAVDASRRIDIRVRGEAATLEARDFRVLAARDELPVVAGAGTAELARRAAAPHPQVSAAIDEAFAARFAIGVGDRVTFASPRGPATARVESVYTDYANAVPTLLVDASRFAKLYADRRVDAVAVYVRPGSDLERLRERIVTAARPFPLEVRTTKEARADAISRLDGAFGLAAALAAATAALALFGVAVTLAALAYERRDELVLLRYLGFSRGGVAAMVVYESAAIASVAAVLGTLLGTALAALLVLVIDRATFGWTSQLAIPAVTVAEIGGAVVASAFVAAAYPARAASHLPIDGRR